MGEVRWLHHRVEATCPACGAQVLLEWELTVDLEQIGQRARARSTVTLADVAFWRPGARGSAVPLWPIGLHDDLGQAEVATGSVTNFGTRPVDQVDSGVAICSCDG